MFILLTMSWRIFTIFLTLIVATSEKFTVEDMLCTEEFCAKYKKEKGCPPLSEACLAQNSTHNGVFLPFPDVCNCCEFCITNLAEGEDCPHIATGLPVPKGICGPGLACAYDSTGRPTCQPMVTECTKAQKDWDERKINGTLGMTEVRPKCDDDGFFAPIHCIPGSICYCLSPFGHRIFGEIPYLESWDENKMSCGCSLNHWRAVNTMDPKFLYEMLTARCNDYGLYDPLQCMMGRQADCLCVDPLNGEPIEDTTVRITQLRPGNPVCFDPSIHPTGVYETECEIMKMKWIEETSPATTTTQTSLRATNFIKPECQPDGKYHRVQNFGKKQICVDPSGRQIEKYETMIASNPLDCNCARVRWLLAEVGVAELPSCCPQGSFQAWQCRRAECFCVDSNGDQQGLEVDEKYVSKLSCYNDNQPCP